MINTSRLEEIRRIKSFETEKGSIYTTLPDLRFQRYKKINNDLRRPHDVTVFIPTHDVLIKSGERYGRDNGIIGKTPQETQTIIEEMILYNYRAQIVVDRAGKHISEVKDLLSTDQAFIALSNSKEKCLYIPVTIVPKIGYGVYQNSRGDRPDSRRTHLGHNVTKINFV